MKPMLASDFEPSRAKFPLRVQPKIDGVRALNPFGKLTARSFKSFKNLFITSLLSHSALRGLDGEMALRGDPYRDRLCSLTTSALGTIKGEPELTWWLFDYVTPETCQLPYDERYELLKRRLVELRELVPPEVMACLQIMPSWTVSNQAELDQAEAYFETLKAEGLIVRLPSAPHKQGRSTAIELGLNRIKRFIEIEGLITDVHEGETNLNEATINALGQTERSTHQENMVQNGMVGAITCALLADLIVDGKVFLAKGSPVKVSAGCMTEAERKTYFANPELILGCISKFQIFPKGMKDKVRFPTHQSLRMPEDMS